MATGTDFKAASNRVIGPCSLAELAEHLRDRRWLDMRTEEGLVARVRIEKIIVMPNRDDIEVRQEWVDGDDEDCRRVRRIFTMDAEAVRRVLPSNYHIEQVAPPSGKREPKREPMTQEQNEHAAKQIIASSVFMHRLASEKELEDPQWRPACYVTMLVMYEMTDLSPSAITRRLGYSSPTPLISSAMWRLRKDQTPQSSTARPEMYVTEENIRTLAELVDTLTEPEKYRSSRAWPNRYTPVLS